MSTRLAIWSGIALVILDPWSIGTSTSGIIMVLATLFGMALVTLGFSVHYERLRLPALYGVFTAAVWGFFDTVTSVVEVMRFVFGTATGSLPVAALEGVMAVLCAVLVAWSLRAIRDERHAQQERIGKAA